VTTAAGLTASSSSRRQERYKQVFVSELVRGYFSIAGRSACRLDYPAGIAVGIATATGKAAGSSGSGERYSLFFNLLRRPKGEGAANCN